MPSKSTDSSYYRDLFCFNNNSYYNPNIVGRSVCHNFKRHFVIIWLIITLISRVDCGSSVLCCCCYFGWNSSCIGYYGKVVRFVLSAPFLFVHGSLVLLIFSILVDFLLSFWVSYGVCRILHLTLRGMMSIFDFNFESNFVWRTCSNTQLRIAVVGPHSVAASAASVWFDRWTSGPFNSRCYSRMWCTA